MNIITLPMFVFVLHIEWFLNTSADKKLKLVCIFENLCSTFCQNAQKKDEKANRKKN